MEKDSISTPKTTTTLQDITFDDAPFDFLEGHCQRLQDLVELAAISAEEEHPFKNRTRGAQRLISLIETLEDELGNLCQTFSRLHGEYCTEMNRLDKLDKLTGIQTGTPGLTGVSEARKEGAHELTC